MKIYFETYGCSLNRGESDIMRELVISGGHQYVNDIKIADVLVLSTCIVIESTENKMIRRITELSRTKKPLIVGGCMASAFPEKVLKINPPVFLLPPTEINSISELVSEIEKFQERKTSVTYRGDARNLGIGGQTFSVVNKKRKSIDDVIATIPISTGCYGICSYCITRVARGRLKSRRIEDVINSVKKTVKRGRKEIQLASQDSGCYGKDIDEDLPKLIKEVCSIEGVFKIRIGMANPNSIVSIIDELIDAYRDDKVFKFLHVPVQSGSERILKAMKRQYTIDDFRYVVERFRNDIPDLTLSTDIIVGYPGESEKDFQQTYELIEGIKPNIVNIKRFSPRPKTEAYKLKMIPSICSKSRSVALTALHLRISKGLNENHIGEEKKILLTEKIKEGTVLGRIENYLPVVVKKDVPLGNEICVKVIKANHAYLEGRIVK
jgi:MiaB-like tRNA modifying enzyme